MRSHWFPSVPGNGSVHGSGSVPIGSHRFPHSGSRNGSRSPLGGPEPELIRDPLRELQREPELSGDQHYAVGEELEGRCVSWVTAPSASDFGFVRVAGKQADMFVGAKRLIGRPRLRPGDRVRFDVRMDRHGRLFADNVDVLS